MKFVMTKREYFFYKLIQTLKSKKFWKKFLDGLLFVLGTFAFVIQMYLLMIIWGEDELHREKLNNQIKQETTYYKAENLP